MTATLTREGKIVVPEEVREHLHLSEGDKVEFVIESDGKVRLRPLPGGVSLFGMLHRPGMPAVTVEEMDEAIAQYHAEDNERIRKGEG